MPDTNSPSVSLKMEAAELRFEAQSMLQRAALLEKEADECDTQQVPITDEATIAALRQLNRCLRKVTAFLFATHEAHAQRQAEAQQQPGSTCLAFTVESRVDFFLRETDPAWQEDADNLLTRREYSCCGDDDRHLYFDLDFRLSSEEQRLFDEPLCYMFHDLNDHTYTLDQKRQPFVDCARIGRISVEVCITETHDLDVDQNTWITDEAQR